MDIQFTHDMTVELMSNNGDDKTFVAAAKVSTGTDQKVSEMTEEDVKKFITFLIANRHASPFEHANFTFRITAPIFVWREFMRHRTFSYNEESGRYKVLEPVFYIPSPERPLIQTGKTGEYNFTEGNNNQVAVTSVYLRDNSKECYNTYTALLNMGIAKEVARMALPVNIMSTAYVTGNLRNFLHFLSLRTRHDDATVVSYPQAEIADVAGQIEDLLTQHMPVTMQVWHSNGRNSL